MADKFEKLADRWCGIAEREQERAETLVTKRPQCAECGDTGVASSFIDEYNAPVFTNYCNCSLGESKRAQIARWRPLDAKYADRNKRVILRSDGTPDATGTVEGTPDPLDADHVG